MNTSPEYLINLKSLKEGQQERAFQIGATFFEPFESSPVSKSDIRILLNIEKRSSHYLLDFQVEGSVKSDCDRCLDEIDLPVIGTFQFSIKYADERREEEEVIFILRSDDTYNISQLIYEGILLSMPMKKIGPDCDLEDGPCADKLDPFFGPDDELEDETDNDDNSDNNVWAELKNLKDLK
ncbi:MAG: DUF177 domain-containing protein [Bacteroidota bacterium]